MDKNRLIWLIEFTPIIVDKFLTVSQTSDKINKLIITRQNATIFTLLKSGQWHCHWTFLSISCNLNTEQNSKISYSSALLRYVNLVSLTAWLKNWHLLVVTMSESCCRVFWYADNCCVKRPVCNRQYIMWPRMQTNNVNK